MLNIDEKRAFFLKILKPAKKCTSDYYDKYDGAGLTKKIKRLARYKLKYIRYVLARLKIYPSRLIFVKTFWGKKIFISVSDASDTSIFYCGICSAEEYKLAKFLIKNLKENDIFYDVGTHIGFYSLLAMEFINNGEIHSFEPAPKTFSCLKETFSSNDKNMFLNNFALSDRIGKIDFYDKSVGLGNASAGSTIVPGVIAKNSSTVYQKITINTLTLDEYIKNHSSPTVLKMDIEGAELQLLKGGNNTLLQNSPIIIIEVWGRDRRKFSFQAVKELYNLGYKSYKINENGDLQYVEEINLERDVPGKWDNFVFKQ